MWIILAVLSALSDGISTIFDKGGLRHCDPNVANAVRSIFVFLVGFVAVIFYNSWNTINDVPFPHLILIITSGISTSLAVLFYYKALSIGNVNKVVPVYKSGVVISILLSMLLYNETNYWYIKLICTVLITGGIFVMIDNNAPEASKGKKWLLFAVIAAFFNGIVSVMCKEGMAEIESNLGVTIRNTALLVITWVILFSKGKLKDVSKLQRHEVFCLVVSGIAWGFSNVFFYAAIQQGIVSVIVPIDRMSALFAVIFAYFIYKERVSKRAAIGLSMMFIGTIVMALCG